MNEEPKTPQDDDNTNQKRKIRTSVRPVKPPVFIGNSKKIRTANITAEEQKEKEEGISERKYRNIQNRGVYINAFMLLAFIVSVYYQGCLTKQSLDKIDTANSYTRQSIDLQIENSKKELRAYLCFDNITNDPPIVGKKYTQGSIILNSGKTPAYNVRARMEYKTGTGVYPKEWSDLVKKQKSAPEMGILGPGQNRGIGIGSDSVFRAKDSIYIYSGILKLYIYGFVTYKDIFGIDRFTECCLVWDLESRKFLLVYGDYNKAD